MVVLCDEHTVNVIVTPSLNTEYIGTGIVFAVVHTMSSDVVSVEVLKDGEYVAYAKTNVTGYATIVSYVEGTFRIVSQTGNTNIEFMYILNS